MYPLRDDNADATFTSITHLPKRMKSKSTSRPVRKKEWFDDEQLWRDLYLFMFSEKRFAEAAEQVPKLLKLVKPRCKTVLDLCCGAGRFSIPVAKAALRVTGVDSTGYLLGKARAAAKRAKVSVEWVQQDMREFVRPEAFDLAVNLFTSFGYFENREDDAQVLANVHRSLRHGGAFVIDLMGKEALARVAQPVALDVLPDGSKLVQRPHICDGWTRIRHEWILIRDGTARTYRFQTNIYSGQELKELLLRAGFGEVKLYGSLEGEEYGLGAKRLVAVAKKT
jgi:SAM-dependent methyltransferase